MSSMPYAHGGAECLSAWWDPQSVACERWSDEQASPEMSYWQRWWRLRQLLTHGPSRMYLLWRLKSLSPLLTSSSDEEYRAFPDYLAHIWEPSDEGFEVSTSQLTKRVNHLPSALNHFWRRWRSEYLNELRVIAMGPRTWGILTLLQVKWLSYTMIPYHTDCGNWDGFWKWSPEYMVCLAVLVQVASWDRQHTLLKRPVQLLYPLKIS